MPKLSDVELLLSQAGELEKEYDWLGAAGFYQKALGLVAGDDFLRHGGICEQLSHAFFRAAFQAENVNEFSNRIRQAVGEYAKAKESYSHVEGSKGPPRALRCEAMMAYAQYWLASETQRRMRLLDDCWRLGKEALNVFSETGEKLEYGKTYNQICTSAGFRGYFDWDCRLREKRTREALDAGERAVAFLSGSEDHHERTTAYVRTATYLETSSYFVQDPESQNVMRERASDYWMKAKQLSEKKAFLEFFHSYCFQAQLIGWEPGTDGAFENLKKALEYGTDAKDKLVIGGSLDWLAYHTVWRSAATENVDERVSLIEAAFKHAIDAKDQFSRIAFISPRDGLFWVEAPEPEYYTKSANCRTDLRERREFLEKAFTTASTYQERAESAGYPDIILLAHHIFSNISSFLAEVQANSVEKEKFLEKALEHRKMSIDISDRITPPAALWNRGMLFAGLANIKLALVDLAKDPVAKRKMLEETLSAREESLRLCLKDMPFFEKRGSVSLFSVLGRGQCDIGDMLVRLYRYTGDRDQPTRALVAFQEAAESFRKLDLVSSMAECEWKMAQAYDSLGEHSKAAERFESASTQYVRASDKIPQLKDFYKDYALYMRAWSEIEKARDNHRRQEYGIAKEHFEKAATIHKSIKKWNYMASNYAAWSSVEHAEELSRKERSEETLNAFECATALFDETKNSLQTELDKIENVDEKQMIIDMLSATELRHDYCIARISLEQAKILDKKGDHYSSSEKYALAAETLEKIMHSLVLEQDKKEFSLILTLSKAWQKMALADAEASPALYLDAAQLFEQAKDFSPNEKTRLLTLGHSRFCKALEVGTRFADSREATLYESALQHLESAAEYYLKADFQQASEYVKATRLLFDAYVHMDDAAREKDLEKKTRLYIIAERLLQASAGSYIKAEHPEKREHVLRLLDKVREERELTASLNEVLHVPIITSTVAFSTPTPTSERAVGLEGLEHAEIQANVIASRNELKIGENLDLEIELANAGKGTASIVRIMEIVPQGFSIVEKPETYRAEDGSLNMKGKRLDPLKVEEIRLVLRPTRQGTFRLQPTISYLDEAGMNKSKKPEPLTVTVKELGIKGWLKGER